MNVVLMSDSLVVASNHCSAATLNLAKFICVQIAVGHNYDCATDRWGLPKAPNGVGCMPSLIITEGLLWSKVQF